MKISRKVVLPFVLVVIVGAVAVKIAGRGSTADPRRQNTPIVQTEQPRRETVTNKLLFTGDVLPIQQASIYSKVSGNLERIYAEMGTYVKVNQVLALVDTTELSQQFRQSAATYENARLTYQRTKELAEQNLVAKQDLDNAEAAMKVARANYETARTHLDYAWVTAPFSGYVTKRYLDPGAFATANNAILYTLMDPDTMKIIVNLLEKDISLITKGKRVVVSVDAYPGKEFVGTVTRYSGAVDLSTRTMDVEVDIPNRDLLLKAGMFANVAVIVDEHKDVVTVPTQALLKDEKGYFVYVVNNKTAHRKDIKTGTEQSARTEVLSGLDGTENIITTGQQFVKDSSQVTIQ